MYKIITTSWDDGHPLDFRLAELLDKYSLKATFYIPKLNVQNEVMDESHIAQLGKRYEIGGHTINHVNLTKLNSYNLQSEIKGCYSWLQEVTGKSPASFCPPFGAYNAVAVQHIHAAGFKVIRSTQLLSVKSTTPISHTTLQLFSHSAFTYAKHLSIRVKLMNLLLWLSSNGVSDLLKLTDYYLDHINANGGCFHLWGHSWEIEKFHLWEKLETVLQHLSELNEFTYVENGQLRDYTSL